jgi:protein involved in polysaccharide export with SLBB domain
MSPAFSHSFSHSFSAIARATRGASVLALMACAAAFAPCLAAAQAASANGLLMSRAELTAAAESADRQGNPALATSIRQRLRDGDFDAGDRIVLGYQTDAPHHDTLLVRPGREVELPWKVMVPLAGLLRSEAKSRLSAEVLKYVKAERVEVTPLMRLGVLGEVGRPGYFAFSSDILITDALMGAGGLTPAADMTRTEVRRGGQAYKSSEETSQAIARGLTLDQFGLLAGDDLVVGQRPEGRLTPTIAIVGALASLLTVYIALHSRSQ